MSDDYQDPSCGVSKEEYIEAYKRTLDCVDQLHEQLSRLNQFVGYSKTILEKHQSPYVALYDKAIANPTLFPIVVSGYDVIRDLENETKMIINDTNGIVGKVVPMSSSTGSFAGTISTTASFSGVTFSFNQSNYPNPLPGKSNDVCIEELRKINNALADTYSQVWECFFGTISDPHRSALFMMRQVYDHFFNILAPDDAVRLSQYWTRKVGEKPEQIYRSERVNYAAFKYIKDETIAKLFASLSKQINDLYDLANEAHTRGELDEDQAGKTVFEMDKILKNWLGVINLEEK